MIYRLSWVEPSERPLLVATLLSLYPTMASTWLVWIMPIRWLGRRHRAASGYCSLPLSLAEKRAGSVLRRCVVISPKLGRIELRTDTEWQVQTKNPTTKLPTPPPREQK